MPENDDPKSSQKPSPASTPHDPGHASESSPADTPPEREIHFRESDGVPIAGLNAPRTRAWHRRATDPPPTPEELALDQAEREAAAVPEPSLEIEWMDEDRPPAQGKLFAEPAPEPPLQPFEIVGAKATAAAAAAPAPYGASAPAGSSAPPRRPPLVVRFLWAFMPALLCIAGFASIAFTQSGIGYAWDEAYYYEPSMLAADWLTDALRGRDVFDAVSIDAAFSLIHEHPDLPKFFIGVAIRCFKNPDMHLLAMRLPSAIMFGLALGLLYLIGRRAFGPVPGLIGVMLFWFCPRVFGHAHFASLEMPLICMTLLVVFCFLRGLDSRLWAVFTGLAFGLLLGTKINGFFLPIPLILWAHLYARTRYVNNLFAMLTLGPLAMVAVWPWLWHDGPLRLLEYLAFHLNHQQTAVFYQDRIWGYGGPNAPWYYPLDILHATLPLSIMLLMILGTARILVRAPRSPYGALFFLCALVPLGVACLPSTPRYDGERLFLPLFPFLALLGAGGFASFVTRIEGLLEARSRHPARRSHLFGRWIALTIGLAIVLEGGSAILRYRPYLLSYFNPLVGGLRGAAELGYEVTYWGEALNEPMIAALNELPEGSKVGVLALHVLCLRHLQQWGVLDASLQFEAEAPYDYHLLLMRRGFFHRPERALADTDIFPSVAVNQKDGIRLIELYKTGPAFEQYWPRVPQVVPGQVYPHTL